MKNRRCGFDFSFGFQVAGEMKHQAITQCREQSALIHRLQEEKQVAYQLRNDEVRKRFQAEGELHSLQTYVEYTERKTREKTRNKSVQTVTSIPLRWNFVNRNLEAAGKRSLDRVGSEKWITSTGSGAVSYTALKSAASLLKLDSIEKNYRKETMKSKQKFNDAAQHSRLNKVSKDSSTLNDDQLHGQHKSFVSGKGSFTGNYSNKDSSPMYENTLNNPHKLSTTEHKLSSSSQTSAPPPPPPPVSRINLMNGNASMQKFNQHSAAMGPAALVYKARIYT